MAEVNSRKPHIALFINSMRKGGAERVMANLAEYLYGQGWRVTLVTTWFDPPEYALPHAGWDVATGKMTDTSGVLIPRYYSEPPEEQLTSSRVGNFRLRFRTLQEIWKKVKPDIILSFIGMTNIMAVLTAKALSIPVVVSVRSTRELEYNTFKLRMLADHVYPKAAGVVFQTWQTANRFPPAVRRKAMVLPNSVNPAFMQPRYRGRRENTIVSVGRLDDNKNQAMLLRAFARVRQDFPSFHLELYGDGPARQSLMALAFSLSLRVCDAAQKVFYPAVPAGTPEEGAPAAVPLTETDGQADVIFEGTRDDIPDRIRKASVYVLCSEIEGMPNSLIEAMSLGLACISTDCRGGGPASLIESGLNGYLIQPGDTNALEAKLRYLLTNREEIDRIGQNAARVQEDYNPEKINRQWETYLLSKARVSPE